MILLLLQGLAAVMLAAAFVALGWAVATRVVAADARPAVRWSAAALVAFFVATVLFWLLAAVGAFRLAVVVAAVVGLAAWALRGAAGGKDLAACWRADLGAAGGTLRAVARSPLGWLLGALGLLAGVVLVRGLVAPPLGWDSLTYHLLKAGRFVQAGALVTERAPDAWQYYEYFPLGGDLLWAWAMLPFRDGLLIAALGLVQWAATLLGLYAAARELGASAPLAATAASAVVAMPAMLVFVSSGYVDNAAMMFFALGGVFVLRVIRGATSEAPLAIAALSCMVGVRLTAAPLLALAALLVGVAVLRAPWPLRRRMGLLAACVLLSLVGAPSYLRAWLEQGSPFYPVRVVVGGFEISRGEPLLRDTLDAVVAASNTLNPAQPRWNTLLYAAAPEGWYANPGPGTVVLVLLAGWGVVTLVRRRAWGPLLWLVASAGVILGALGSAEMAVYRVAGWSNTVGRLLLPGLGALALLAAAAGPRWPKTVTALLALATAAGVVWSLPRGFSTVELGGLVAASSLVVVCGVGLGGVHRWRRQGGHVGVAWLLAALVLALGLAGTARVRGQQRYLLYEDAAAFTNGVYHLHPLGHPFVDAWPLWRALDQPEGLRIAAFAGWDGLGHNNFRYPLLGSRLQNLVLYVPITQDGSIVDARFPDLVRERADLPAWLERLAAAEVDVVVSLAPPNSIEDYWVKSLPQLFEPLVGDAERFSIAYRFRRDRLPPTDRR